jgi:hypothetical protein
LFTEFNSTYAYNWPGSPYTSKAQYEAALMQQYLRAVDQIHAQYSQAKVALGFGGYYWFNTPNVDLTPYMAAINASDFVASQEMHSVNNVQVMSQQITNSVHQLGQFGKPVMISHFKMTDPSAATDGGCVPDAMLNFEQATLNDAALQQLKEDGLWAWNFMAGSTCLKTPGPAFDALKTVITNNAASSAFPN